MKKTFIIMLIALLFGCRGTKLPLETVERVDLEKYAGLWYEIAHLPVSFQKNCQCTTAEYKLTDKDYIRVINRCYNTKKDEWDEAKGKAFVVSGSNNSKLKVQFFWPFRGDYWIIKLGDDYEYAVVGNKNRDYLWILSRTKQMDEGLYESLVAEMKEKEFPVEDLIRTRQDCEEVVGSWKLEAGRRKNK